MRIALINPVARRCQGYHTIGSKIPQLGLQVLAERTPEPHQVDLIDEIFGFDATDSRVRRGNYDLVGISATTINISRGYALLAQLRAMGVQTVLPTLTWNVTASATYTADSRSRNVAILLCGC